MTDMVSLAEETGRLEDVLLSLQRHYDRQLRMAADIRGAVAVPVTRSRFICSSSEAINRSIFPYSCCCR